MSHPAGNSSGKNGKVEEKYSKFGAILSRSSPKIIQGRMRRVLFEFLPHSNEERSS